MGLEPVTSCLASRSRGWNEIETEEEASDLIAVRFWSESLSLSLFLSHTLFLFGFRRCSCIPHLVRK